VASNELFLSSLGAAECSAGLLLFPELCVGPDTLVWLEALTLLSDWTFAPDLSAETVFVPETDALLELLTCWADARPTRANSMQLATNFLFIHSPRLRVITRSSELISAWTLPIASHGGFGSIFIYLGQDIERLKRATAKRFPVLH
jgi:hypothetical protein